MKSLIKYTLVALSATAVATPLSAQTEEEEEIIIYEIEETSGSDKTEGSIFSIKLSANIGLGNTLQAKYSLNSMTQKSNSGDYSVEFGWKFWEKKNNSLELFAGLGYSPVSTKLNVGDISYNYNAPASADMDGDTYIRYYELKDLEQKISLSRLTIPLYLRYTFKCNDLIGIYGDLGFRLGFPVNSSISSVKGSSYSYGIYPQYDDLKIDESYLNDFGQTNLEDSYKSKPDHNSFSASFLVGAGVEFNIIRQLSLGVGVRYDLGFANLYKNKDISGKFTSDTAPVTYTVKDGQAIKPLSDWLKSSKLSQIAINIALTYRF